MKLKKYLGLAGVAAVTVGVGALTTSAFAFQTLQTKGVFTVNNTYAFKHVVTIPLPGEKGHGDVPAIDPHNGRIFVSMHGPQVDVVSTKTNKVIKVIKDIPGPADIRYYKGYMYVAQGPGKGALNAIVVIGADSLKVIDKVKTQGTTPDEMTINPETHTLYVGMDDDNWVEVYNVSNPAKPVYEKKFDMLPPDAISGTDSGLVVPHLNKLFWSDDWYQGIYNAKTGAPEHLTDLQIPLKKYGACKGNEYVASNNTVWVATTDAGNHGMFILNAKTGEIEKTLPEMGGVDGTAQDTKLHLIYAFMRWHGSHGFDVYDTNKEERIAHVNVPSGQTHTGVVDPNTHVVYAFGGDEGNLYGFKPVKIENMK